MAYYKFERKWTNISRYMIYEYEEIKSTRLKIFDYNFEQNDKLSRNSCSVSIKYQFDSRESFVSILKDEIAYLCDQLHIINIYMNKTIKLLINRFEKILEDEMKLYLESLDPIFFNIKEIENTYSQTLTDNMKYIMNKSDKVIPIEFMNYFGSRLVLTK